MVFQCFSISSFCSLFFLLAPITHNYPRCLRRKDNKQKDYGSSNYCSSRSNRRRNYILKSPEGAGTDSDERAERIAAKTGRFQKEIIENEKKDKERMRKENEAAKKKVF